MPLCLVKNFDEDRKMKKSLYFNIRLFCIILITICTSYQFLSALGPARINGVDYYTTHGDSCYYYGYEGFPWGSSYESIKEKTGWELSEERGGGNGVYHIGDSTTYYAHASSGTYYPHGYRGIYKNKTRLSFMEDGYYDVGSYSYKRNYSVLYAAEDEYKKTPPIGFLHAHYGDFSEENVVSEVQKMSGIETVYKSQPYLSAGDFYGLEILIYKKGRTVVKLSDPFIQYTKSNYTSENTWVCYAALDNQYLSKVDYTRAKRINFTFLNKNKEGKYLFIGYSKGYEDSGISYVRAGVCWSDKNENEVSVYDIKGDTGLVSEKYSIEKWQCGCNKKEYFYTYLPENGSRDILSLFLESNSILVRHNNTTSEFDCSAEQLKKKMSEFGITWEELDSALQNEEF